MFSRSASETAPLFLRASCIYELTQSHSNQASRKVHRDLLGFFEEKYVLHVVPSSGVTLSWLFRTRKRSCV